MQTAAGRNFYHFSFNYHNYKEYPEQPFLAMGNYSHRLKIFFTALFFAACAIFAFPQEPEAAPDSDELSEEDYSLIMENTRGLTVQGEAESPGTVTREDMQRNGANDLWEAVRDVPGVIQSGGGRRGDSNFTVRGFGADSVPVFADGIEQSNPYRGEGDSARLLTGDLEKIEILKGFSSELLGANILGGAVLLRTAKPEKKLELGLNSVLGLDSVFSYAQSTQVLSAGTRQKLFYAKGVFQYRDVDHFRLPASFEPSAGNPQQAGNRLWSNSSDLKLTLLAGLTPAVKAAGQTGQLDLWLSGVYEDSDKNFSPPEVRRKDYSMWDWPFWKRRGISANGEGDFSFFKFSTLFYFTKYDNRLDVYHNFSQANAHGAHEPHSDYDEWTAGARLAVRGEINNRNVIEAALTWKKDDHRGLKGNMYNDEMTEQVHINEDTLSFGAEWSGKPLYLFFKDDLNKSESLTVRAGAGFDVLLPGTFYDEENEFAKLLDLPYFTVKTKPVFLLSAQAGLFYKPLPAHEFRLTYARKNHFPTMSERYSTRSGTAMPNPNLKPETANHFEAGWQGGFLSIITLDAALYYSILGNKIVNVGWPDPNEPTVLVDYSRNIDSVSFWGFEFAPAFRYGDLLKAGASLSLNGYVINRSFDGDLMIPCYPAVTASAFAALTLFGRLTLTPGAVYTGARMADTSGNVQLDGYFLFSFKASCRIWRYFTVSLAAGNIFDTYYEIREYYPQPGRSFTFSFEATL